VASINRLNNQIAAEVGGFPFSSAVGGFNFEFDPVVGDFVRTTESLGPIMSERSTTQGRGRGNVNFSWTYVNYSEFGGSDLSKFEVVAIRMNLDISAQILALSSTYGLTDKLDVVVLVPYAMVDMDVVSEVCVEMSPENTLFPEIHTFDGGGEEPIDRASGSPNVGFIELWDRVG